MKKLLILLLAATAALSAFAFGCKGSADNSNGQNGNVNMQELIEEDENCPDGNCPKNDGDDNAEPSPDVLPHMRKKRNDKLPPHNDPAPVPPRRHRK
ncbi:MAG: hypothetical protein K2I30_05750 [Clostridia bacterium]|nr:hypothetical protein [Clostridia bacterium]